MTYPRRYLGEGEKIIVERGLHPIRLSKPITQSVLVFGGCGAGFLLWKNSPPWFGLALGIVFVATLSYLFFKVMAFRSTHFVLTNRRVIYRSGVFRRVSRDIPLASIQSTATAQPLLRRMIGVGDLKVSAAGAGDTEPFYDLRRPAQLESMIHKAMEDCERNRLQTAMIPEQSVAPNEQSVAPDDQSVAHDQHEHTVNLHEHMVNLHKRGVITNDEFEQYRRSLG